MSITLMRTACKPFVATRLYTTATATKTKNFGKYAYYDSVLDIKDLNEVHEDSVYIQGQLKRNEKMAAEAAAAAAAPKN
ncbi:hypothetical protein C6P42_000793 [Pichia californica]|nr:hypothetical protein C6P42_000793 [[Candida] californica]